jgi:cyanophycin synthetase
MELRDSRRLTGPNLVSNGPGAVIDVAVAEQDVHRVVAAWRRRAQQILGAVGLDPDDLFVRRFRGGASLVAGAPIDALYAACEINEWAWSSDESLEDAVQRLGTVLAEERNPALLVLADAATRHGVGFLSDDDFASVGYGEGSITWPVGELPDPDDVDWSQVHDIPILLVTGTNGKSTTVRLLAAIAKAWGKTPGLSSTDGLFVDDKLLEAGDYSGPGGARTVLRNRQTQVAILETARGGMLRRGLGVTRADAVALLNVADDHVGEYGIEELDDLVDAKLIIRKAVEPERPIVLNADDPLSAARAAEVVRSPITWFSLDPQNPRIVQHLEEGGTACLLDSDAETLTFVHRGRSTTVAAVGDVPITFGGHARFNIENALAAIGLAMAVDIPTPAIAAGLAGFQSNPRDNPGRGNVFNLGGVTAIVDFAHNPHGMRALLAMANAMPARRRLVTLGQAGDRTDEQIREMVRAVWDARPDRIVLKEMTRYLRGREPGAVLDIMADELARQGAPTAVITRTDSELAAVRHALAWAEAGDLLLFSVQAQRDEVIALLQERVDT